MRSGRNFGSFDSQYTPFKQKKPHSIIFTRSWVLVYITFAHGRTDGQTFFEKVLFFSADQEYIYMSIPISTISQISPPFWPKLVYLFSYGNGYENITEDVILIWVNSKPPIFPYVTGILGTWKLRFARNLMCRLLITLPKIIVIGPQGPVPPI